VIAIHNRLPRNYPPAHSRKDPDPPAQQGLTQQGPAANTGTFLTSTSDIKKKTCEPEHVPGIGRIAAYRQFAQPQSMLSCSRRG